MIKKAKLPVKISAGLKISKKAGQSLSPVIIKFLLVLSGCLGSVFCLLTCVDMPAGRFAPVLTAVIACGAFTLAFNLKPKLSGAASIAVSAVFLAIVFFLRYQICAGLANTVNIYLARVREVFRNDPLFIIAEPDKAALHVTIFICFYTAFLCMLTAYFASRSSFSMGICISVLIFPIAVLMFGLEPDYVAFAAVIAVCAASLALENSSPEKISSGKCEYATAHSGLAAALTAAVCFGIVTAFVKLGGYERPERIDQLYDDFTGYVESGEMKNAVSEILTITIKNPGQSGAINHGKLGEFDEITFDNKAILQVAIPKSKETIYLRGFVGAVYTGRSWEALPSSEQQQLERMIGDFSTEGLSPLLLDSYSLKNSPSTYLSSYSPAIPQYSFAVKNIAGGRNYLYMPYNLVPESVARYSIRGDSSFAGGESSYLGQFYDPSGNYGYQNLFKVRWQSLNPALTADEAQYRNFVYTYYMGLPDKFSAADSIFNDEYYEYISSEEIQTGKSTLDEMTVFSRKLYYIKNWLRKNCTYSLSAGKLPAGEDFVENFLTNRKGSCSHFASTAALMCRYAGIPARYVEGYIIKPGDFPSDIQYGESAIVDVTDYRGHAWVEIYIDGFGWYPMEFTSGYGNVRTALPTETVTEPATETEISSEAETEPMEDTDEASETTAPQDGTPQPDGENSAAAVTETTITSNVNEVTETAMPA
ncbi:MAG: transglutaminase domain-containing protein, partial [Oscillospiraceae bacterium]|nr:transglutaminase domain-containing protein [Oscillospiraceae bacterium]